MQMTEQPPAPQFSAEQYRLTRMKALHAVLITIFDVKNRGERMSTELEVIADTVIELAELSIVQREADLRS